MVQRRKTDALIVLTQQFDSVARPEVGLDGHPVRVVGLWTDDGFVGARHVQIVRAPFVAMVINAAHHEQIVLLAFEAVGKKCPRAVLAVGLLRVIACDDLGRRDGQGGWLVVG